MRPSDLSPGWLNAMWFGCVVLAGIAAYRATGDIDAGFAVFFALCAIGFTAASSIDALGRWIERRPPRYYVPSHHDHVHVSTRQMADFRERDDEGR